MRPRSAYATAPLPANEHCPTVCALTEQFEIEEYIFRSHWMLKYLLLSKQLFSFSLYHLKSKWWTPFGDSAEGSACPIAQTEDRHQYCERERETEKEGESAKGKCEREKWRQFHCAQTSHRRLQSVSTCNRNKRLHVYVVVCDCDCVCVLHLSQNRSLIWWIIISENQSLRSHFRCHCANKKFEKKNSNIAADNLFLWVDIADTRNRLFSSIRSTVSTLYALMQWLQRLCCVRRCTGRTDETMEIEKPIACHRSVVHNPSRYIIIINHPNPNHNKMASKISAEFFFVLLRSCFWPSANFSMK